MRHNRNDPSPAVQDRLRALEDAAKALQRASYAVQRAHTSTRANEVPTKKHIEKAHAEIVLAVSALQTLLNI